MKINLTIEFNYDLNDIVHFISKDKPIAARNFKNELVKKLKKDLVDPFHFKNLYILMMKILEIMFLKDTLQS
ncbi:hypothetical protein QQY79_06585 [Flavobacterium tructae]|uniref:hypothetical protein n=1 Tax=Flavobacterium tructae TaxID=1114873 RepID=UPI00255205B7|nr:hypothetical protein [Flavobacterium tructae]MDL2142182.1 hypothetical protein [Flavobacterium tructae]